MGRRGVPSASQFQALNSEEIVNQPLPLGLIPDPPWYGLTLLVLQELYP